MFSSHASFNKQQHKNVANYLLYVKIRTGLHKKGSYHNFVAFLNYSDRFLNFQGYFPK